ncbi:glycerol-3-phosphate responsive antiterminator [Acetobacterium bakii]|uniref:Antiterminator n=1 Tax=Acetobacterium bakii TaxID=52689 RepID=A0A0L6U5E5_9FIRM|nr:glycerol-3-phosphate responsive antiterminator [Acetobacterium bakii]KNZ43010.1 antiterminator [Acetobacterium bakii]
MFQDNPIIVAVRNPKDIYDAIQSESQIIFLLTGNVFNLKKMVELCNKSGKYVFTHLDLIKGYSQDNYFIKYLKDEINPTGVITTKNNIITRAKQENLLTIQRLFLLDSSAMDISINSARKIKPDAIEILPGLVPKLIKNVKKEINIPIVTGGFIETVEEVRSCLAAGAISVSTSHKPLWDSIPLIKKEQQTLLEK